MAATLIRQGRPIIEKRRCHGGGEGEMESVDGGRARRFESGRGYMTTAGNYSGERKVKYQLRWCRGLENMK